MSSIYLSCGNDGPYCPVYIFIVGTVVHSVLYIAFSVVEMVVHTALFIVLSCVGMVVSTVMYIVTSVLEIGAYCPCVYLSLSWELVSPSFLYIAILSRIYLYRGNNGPYCPFVYL